MNPFFNYGGFGFPQGQFSQQSPFMGGFNPYQMQGNFGGQQFSGMPNQSGFYQRQFNPPRQPRPTIGNPNIDPSQISGGFRSAIQSAQNNPTSTPFSPYGLPDSSVYTTTQQDMMGGNRGGGQGFGQVMQGGGNSIGQNPALQNALGNFGRSVLGGFSGAPTGNFDGQMSGMGAAASQRQMQGGFGPKAPDTSEQAYNQQMSMANYTGGGAPSYEQWKQQKENPFSGMKGMGMGGGFGGQQPQFNPFQQQFSQMSRFQPQQQFGGFQPQFNPYQQQYGGFNQFQMQQSPYGFSQFPQFQNRGLLY
jgi:hypothetical protein